jgi:cytosine/adenosine deaminase-related metal-dependent hydrolase
VFAATAADVTRVMVGGQFVVRDGVHHRFDVAGELKDAIGR